MFVIQNLGTGCFLLDVRYLHCYHQDKLAEAVDPLGLGENCYRFAFCQGRHLQPFPALPRPSRQELPRAGQCWTFSFLSATLFCRTEICFCLDCLPATGVNKSMNVIVFLRQSEIAIIVLDDKLALIRACRKRFNFVFAAFFVYYGST